VNLLPLIQDHVPLFWVILVRVAGILAAVPAIGARSVPLQVRIGLVLGLAVILFPIVGGQLRPLQISFADALPLMFMEFMVGLVLGFSIRFVMTSFEIAGELIGLQMGINLIAALDPIAGTQVPLLGQLMGILAFLIFLSIDGHHVVLEALVSSFQLVPPLHAHLSGSVVEAILELAVGMFVLALKIGAPVMTALFIVTLAMGILGRSIPQLNVMLNNVPITVGIGLLVLGISLPLFGATVQASFAQLDPTLRSLLALMGQPR
jgi:flagellar biosynthetic protein FliR